MVFFSSVAEPPRSSPQQDVSPVSSTIGPPQQIEEDRGPPPLNPEEFPNASSTVRRIFVCLCVCASRVRNSKIFPVINKPSVLKIQLMILAQDYDNVVTLCIFFLSHKTKSFYIYAISSSKNSS